MLGDVGGIVTGLADQNACRRGDIMHTSCPLGCPLIQWCVGTPNHHSSKCLRLYSTVMDTSSRYIALTAYISHTRAIVYIMCVARRIFREYARRSNYLEVLRLQPHQRKCAAFWLPYMPNKHLMDRVGVLVQLSRRTPGISFYPGHACWNTRRTDNDNGMRYHDYTLPCHVLG